jgi:hypothetical protein
LVSPKVMMVFGTHVFCIISKRRAGSHRPAFTPKELQLVAGGLSLATPPVVSRFHRPR